MLLLALVAASSRAQLLPNPGGQRVGISALQFLKIGAGARGVAMGESFVAVANDASALFWNPAGIAQTPDNQMIAAHTEYVADIRHEFLGATYHITESDVVGLSVIALHTDDMEITTETQPFGTGRYFRFGDIAVGLTYARKMTDQFSVGLTVRYAEETLDVLSIRSLMVDLGTWYWTGLGSTRFAVMVSNFGADVSPSGSVTSLDGQEVSTFQKYSLPTVFRLGFALDPVASGPHLLTVSAQLNHPNDNSENFRLGLEYTWDGILSVRAGVKRTIRQSLLGEDETTAESFSVGAGVKVPLNFTTAGADYAYSAFGRLGGIHRINVAFTY